jgi:hypothetical protein
MSALALSVCVFCRLMVCHRSVLTRTMHPFVPWSSAILVEPMFLRPDFGERTGKFLMEGAIKRRDVWSSREEADNLFRERSFKSWDPRVIDLHVVRIRSMSDAPMFLLLDRNMAYESFQPLPTLTRPGESRSIVQRSKNLCVMWYPPSKFPLTPILCRLYTMRTTGVSARNGSSQLFARISQRMLYLGQSRILSAPLSTSNHKRVLKRSILIARLRIMNL